MKIALNIGVLGIVLVAAILFAEINCAFVLYVLHNSLTSGQKVRVGPGGCILGGGCCGYPRRGWWLDPCPLIATMACAVPHAIRVGMIGWVEGIDFLRVRWQVGLLGAFAGLDNGQFVQGIRGVQAMGTGFGLLVFATLLLAGAGVVGLLIREPYRALLHAEVKRDVFGMGCCPTQWSYAVAVKADAEAALAPGAAVVNPLALASGAAVAVGHPVVVEWAAPRQQGRGAPTPAA
jgi:hypothetical protein